MTMYAIHAVDCDACVEPDIQMYMEDFRSGAREIVEFDDSGDEVEIDPSTLTEEQLRQYALDEMGEDWAEGWMYPPDDAGNTAIGLDPDPAWRFTTRLEAESAMSIYRWCQTCDYHVLEA